ncbi:MAG: hypothetical protein R3E88_21230 [Myxococcota bacterium]
MVAELDIVVSCTYRKRARSAGRGVPEAEWARMRDVDGASADERVRAWKNLLLARAHLRAPASAMYAGDHWTTALELPKLAEHQGWQARLHVCSAGYGLITPDEPIAPYSATFSPSPDFVGGACASGEKALAAQLWWEQITGGSGIASRCTGQRIIVIASAKYLSAIEADVLAAASGNPERLLVISSGAKNSGPLGRFLLPADARLQAQVGGVRQALNARLARDVIAHLDPNEVASFERIRVAFKRKLTRAAAVPHYDRISMDDDDVRQYIAKRLASDGQLSRSRLLRQLRDSGHACEQKRFGNLFNEVRKRVHAQTR